MDTDNDLQDKNLYSRICLDNDAYCHPDVCLVLSPVVDR